MLEIDQLETEVFGPVSFALEGGTSLVVQGASGSGKSRFLRAIADLDPSRGEVSLEGILCSQTEGYQWRRMVRFVAAEAAWWHATARAHFEEPDELGAALDALNLTEELLDAPIDELSTGERQRLAFLRSIADKPKVLLLDEPTGALDTASTAKMEALFQAELQRGAIIIMVTHDERQAALFGPPRLLFDAGRATLEDAA